MMKLKILDMKEFLKAVNGCTGPVQIVDSDGRKENINKEYGIQAKLQAEYQRNRKILSLCLSAAMEFNETARCAEGTPGCFGMRPVNSVQRAEALGKGESGEAEKRALDG